MHLIIIESDISGALTKVAVIFVSPYFKAVTTPLLIDTTLGFSLSQVTCSSTGFIENSSSLDSPIFSSKESKAKENAYSIGGISSDSLSLLEVSDVCDDAISEELSEESKLEISESLAIKEGLFLLFLAVNAKGRTIPVTKTKHPAMIAIGVTHFLSFFLTGIGSCCSSICSP